MLNERLQLKYKALSDVSILLHCQAYAVDKKNVCSLNIHQVHCYRRINIIEFNNHSTSKYIHSCSQNVFRINNNQTRYMFNCTKTYRKELCNTRIRTIPVSMLIKTLFRNKMSTFAIYVILYQLDIELFPRE